MQVIKKFKKHGQIVEDCTVIGGIVDKIASYRNKQYPYEGRVVYEKLALLHRPTIPGLFFHFLRSWLFRQKCDIAHDRN